MKKIKVKDVVHEKCVRKTFSKIGDFVEIPNLLKRFTERLIDKYGYDKLTHEPDEDIEIYLTASELDETLKEYE